MSWKTDQQAICQVRCSTVEVTATSNLGKTKVPRGPEYSHYVDQLGTNNLHQRWSDIQKRETKQHTVQPHKCFWVYIRRARHCIGQLWNHLSWRKNYWLLLLRKSWMRHMEPRNITQAHQNYRTLHAECPGARNTILGWTQTSKTMIGEKFTGTSKTSSNIWTTANGLYIFLFDTRTALYTEPSKI